MNNLAGNPAYASKVQELHGLLTSLVHPGAITEAAFKEQHGVLTEMVRNKTPHEFFHTFMGRLGRGQATALTGKCYQNWLARAAWATTP